MKPARGARFLFWQEWVLFHSAKQLLFLALLKKQKNFYNSVFYLAIGIVGLYQNAIRKGLNEYFGLLLIPEGTHFLLSHLRYFIILKDRGSSFQLVESSPLAN